MLSPAQLYSPDSRPSLNNVRNSYRPATSLTGSIPQGVGNVEILALGPSHLKNLLYTAYHEKGFPQRTAHVTIVDSFELDIVLHTVFLTLVHEIGNDLKETDLEDLWEIISYPSLSERAHATLLQHLKELVATSESLQTWRSGQWATAIRFNDEDTLTTIRGYLDRAVSEYKSNPDAQRQVQVPKLNQLSQHEEVNRFVVSASPLAQQARPDVWETTKHFFTQGTFSVSSEKRLPNPLYFAAPGDIAMPENPVGGFHLATAYTPLTEMSPLKADLDAAADGYKSVRAAQVQFNEWVPLLAEALGKTLSISLVVADPLAYCDSLQRLAEGEQDAWTYRKQDSSVPLRIGTQCTTEFDTIEASNITGNKLQTLLALASAAPLLKNQAWATLISEFVIRMGEMRENPLEDMLYMDTPAMCLLLGVSPAEIITNTSSASIVDDVLLGIEDEVPLGNQTSAVYYRLSWKRNHSLVSYSSRSTLAASADQFVDFLLELDNKITTSEQREVEPLRNRGTSPLYRMGLLAPLLRTASRNINFPVSDVCRKLLKSGNEETKRAGIPEEISELALQLHRRGLYSAEQFTEEAGDLPPVAAVSIIVDSSHLLEKYFEVPEIDPKALLFEAKVIYGENQVELFRDLQCMGASDVAVSGPAALNQFSERGLNLLCAEERDGKKLMVVSFWASTALLMNDGVEIELVGVPYPTVDTMYGVTVYRGKLSEELSSSQAKVVVTSAMPTSTHESIPFTTNPPVETPTSDKAKDGEDSQEPTTFRYIASDKAVTLVARQNLYSQLGRMLLAEKVPIAVKQSGPYSIDLVFGHKKQDATVYTLHYPTTVTSVGSKARIARTSAYVEIITPFATHGQTTFLSDLIFPSTLSSNGLPVPLNLPHLNLDTLPALDLSDQEANKWITTLTSFQFSHKERQERESANEKTGMTQSPRINFKESLFSMFMASTGLQGGQTGLFVLNQPGGEGVHMIVFVSAVRLDCASSSVVLDAAVMPITGPMLKDEEVTNFLLLLRTLEICSLDVDADELQLWKKALPAMAERCRTWEHLPTCEYTAPGASAPLSLEQGGPVLCSCGKDQMPETFLSLPGWKETASRHAVRVAISPAFACPMVERTVDFGPIMPREKDVVRCKSCGKKEKELEEGDKLKRCTRCRKVWYCSGQCQKKDWKKHRFECKEEEEK